MKVLVLLASLVGVILVAILPPPAAGLKCVACLGNSSGQSSRFSVDMSGADHQQALGAKPCRDYKKGDKGDKEYGVTCTSPSPVCFAVKNYQGSGCATTAGGRAGGCRHSNDYDVCFCNEDLCNRSTKALGGSGAGILLISLGLGVILLPLLFH